MLKLRLILLILLVSVFPLLWIGSHVSFTSLGYYDASTRRQYNLFAASGGLFLCEHDMSLEIDAGFPTPGGGLSFDPPKWSTECKWDTQDESPDDLQFSFAGFGYKSYDSNAFQTLNEVPAGFIRIPFWFLSCLGYLLGWWLWRRGRRTTAAGFPVEPHKPN